MRREETRRYSAASFTFMRERDSAVVIRLFSLTIMAEKKLAPSAAAGLQKRCGRRSEPWRAESCLALALNAPLWGVCQKRWTLSVFDRFSRDSHDVRQTKHLPMRRNSLNDCGQEFTG